LIEYKGILNSVIAIALRLLFNCGSMGEDAHSIQVNTRIPVGLIQEIDALVTEDRFRSRGDFVLAAVRHYLDLIAIEKRYVKLEPTGQPSFEEFAKSAREKT